MKAPHKRKFILAFVSLGAAMGLVSCGVGYDTMDTDGGSIPRGEVKKVEKVIDDYHAAMSDPNGANWDLIRSDIACGGSSLHKKATTKIGGNQRSEVDYPGGDWELVEYTRMTKTSPHNWRAEYNSTYHSRKNGTSMTKARVAMVYDNGNELCLNAAI